MLDILIRNGKVVDGKGNPAYQADVGICNGRIVTIAPHSELPAGRTIEAEGMIVGPGFVDAHSHTDRHILFGRDGYNYLEQGVTTQITGPCGSAHAPYFFDCSAEKLQEVGAERKREADEAAVDFPHFIENLRKRELGTNYAFFASQGNIRGKVMGFRQGAPTQRELEEMLRHLREAMELGYLGFSTGLIYPPSVYADQAELIQFAKTVAPYGGRYSTHIRSEGDRVIESIQEAVEIGRAADIPVIISHVKVVGKHNEGLSERILELFEQVNASGVQMHGDMYPYLGGSGGLSTVIPPKYAVGGKAQMKQRLLDRSLRKQIERDIFSAADGFESNLRSAGYEGCVVVNDMEFPQNVGKSIREIATERGAEEFDTLCDLITEHKGDSQMVFFNQNESDMMRFLASPYICSGSDWSEYRMHFPEEQRGGAHPRGTATMVRRLELIRDHRILPLEESIRRITSYPAEIAGIEGVGILEKNARADICVFDYEHLRSHADYLHPFRRNEGISYVLMGGKVAVEDGKATGVLNGAILEKGKRNDQ